MLRTPESRGRRRGSVLVEFALISLVLYLLLAVTIEFGRMIFTAQAAQTAADVGARELAKTPLPPGVTFDKVLTVPIAEVENDAELSPAAVESIKQARERVYDRKYLVLPLDDADLPPNLPLINRHLFTLMIVDDLPDGTRVRRYPGELVALAENAFGYTVVVPVLNAAGTDYDVVEVVEEVRPTGATAGPFSLVAPDNPPDLLGFVALRINYPYQAAALTGFRPNPNDVPGEPPNPNIDTPVLANDGDTAVGTYAGPRGLGRQYAFGKEVRPYRKVISTQAFARREIFN